MILASMETACTIPISICIAYISSKDVPLEPCILWSNVHFDFSYMNQIPAAEWMSDPGTRTSIEMTRWLPVVCAILFFFLRAIWLCERSLEELCSCLLVG